MALVRSRSWPTTSWRWQQSWTNRAALSMIYPPVVGPNRRSSAAHGGCCATSSLTFANNQGLSGYARDIKGVATPELLMKIETVYKRIVYEEPLELQQGSMAAMFGKFAGAESVQVECVWRRTTDDAMAVTSQRVVVGGNSWEPADRQDKAVRALGAARPVFLDEQLLVLRCEPDYIVWVFARA